MEKKIIRIMIILLICIIIISGLLVVIYLNNRSDSGIDIFNSNLSKGEIGEEKVYNELEKVSSKTDFYTVINCINSYLNALNKNSSTYYIANDYQQKIQIEYLYNILSMEENNINKDNIMNNLEIYEEKMLFIPLGMEILKNKNVDKYMVHGIIQNLQNKNIKTINIIVNLDFKNNTYSIEPIINQKQIENKNIQIEKNSYNIYMIPNVNNQYIINEYLSVYRLLALSSPKDIYNMLDESYREKRFENQANFEKYIYENSTEISKIKLKQYLVNNYDTYTEYVAKDQNDNLYIFKETNVGEFIVILDTYTLEQEKFNVEYKKATNKDKVIMNIDKFFQMINAKDYKTSYKILNNNFKNLNFKTEDSFKDYMKSKLYNYNDVAYINYSDEISGVFTYYIEISNRENKSDKKIKMNIVMQLLEGTDYTLSFEILD